jgi:hypothetical protein
MAHYDADGHSCVVEAFAIPISMQCRTFTHGRCTTPIYTSRARRFDELHSNYAHLISYISGSANGTSTLTILTLKLLHYIAAHLSKNPRLSLPHHYRATSSYKRLMLEEATRRYVDFRIEFNFAANTAIRGFSRLQDGPVFE